jgi:hypothetical protein
MLAAVQTNSQASKQLPCYHILLESSSPVVLRFRREAEERAESKQGRGGCHRRARASRGAEVAQPPSAPHASVKGTAEQ